MKNIKKQFQNFTSFSFRGEKSYSRFEKFEKKSIGGEIKVSILKECEFIFEFLKN